MLDLATPRSETRDGDFSPVCVGRARFHGVIGLTRAGNPHRAGFQRRMLDSAGKNSAWAAGPEKRRGTWPFFIFIFKKTKFQKYMSNREIFKNGCLSSIQLATAPKCKKNLHLGPGAQGILNSELVKLI